MPHIDLSAHDALVIAATLASIGWALRLLGRGRAVLFGRAGTEAALVTALYALWATIGSYAVTHVDGAFAHAEWIWRTERAWHLPDEASVQSVVLPHPLLAEASNVYYAYSHFNGLMVFLAWLWFRHRDAYPKVRASLIIFTAASMAIQTIPVAPPRMLVDHGLVDTGLRFGQSVYAAGGSGSADQLAAMPSIHVGWAVLIAIVAIRVSPSPWRWLVLAHPVLMSLVVVATANHFWADGIVAVWILGLALPAPVLWARWRSRARSRGLPSAGPVTALPVGSTPGR